MSKLLLSQKKKMRQKQRKAEARAKKEEESKNEETKTSNASKFGKEQVKAVDPDPNGEKLLQFSLISILDLEDFALCIQCPSDVTQKGRSAEAQVGFERLLGGLHAYQECNR
ncbi:N-terminal acetyltransferase A complex auxiliary subunit NAA15 isoform X1 [Spinacia oleracea]|uniref:N-terminal acetyltransferase A complex auxiliary subunit NAA15 isoform X1 n=1 Tax=Spinacia oleracea TaxID=3562 RepID=A0ABM3R4P1_SPIOL|nr:N-terminal acetyltransferase A complex auxiliary subunit NAA15-like isoform X1 [Spinacia oleracea]XP_056690581.1 N-terminal acetyltransferase A complex auxiliary subunit NAA15-like isoform X1 [Spinacia oleracea]XP_056690582.1 N-terminal acetyltransferase A complex auxiliary subunit NAA15-like isoform X1 [Spinacia oleracea]XP_056690583.1 N-terminal acetyltransferase A complex auxiliary subunit NAA15-like isoform X1 [Spinacia oleracea]